MNKLLTLAIPTNGISEWVFPVLESIYNQNVNNDKFEVIVTDNGNNELFYTDMIEFAKNHNNLLYKKTNVVMFDNQIEAFKLATGEFIKFVNHRTKLTKGSLQYMLDYVESNRTEKPVTFFLNSVTEPKVKDYIYSDFDSFLYGISYYLSWSGGVSCWKEDLANILSKDRIQNSSLFPHTCFLFINDFGRTYHIDNRHIFDEIPSDAVSKGSYDLFYAFGVEFVELILTLLKNKLIDDMTYNEIINANEKFIVQLYGNYVILRKKCSYNLSSAEKSLNTYYTYSRIKRKTVKYLAIKVLRKITAKL